MSIDKNLEEGAKSEKVKKIKSFDQIQISDLDTNTLFLLDLDDTVITYKDDFMRDKHRKQRDEYIKKLKEEKGEEGVTKFYENVEYTAGSNSLYRFLKKLNNSKIPFLGFTARRTGRPNAFSLPAEVVLFKNLKKLGIKFNHRSYPNNVWIEYPGSDKKIDPRLREWEQGTRSQCKNSVIFCCNRAKDLILKSYLDISIAQPEKIVMIDDSLKNLEVVESFCIEKGIDYDLYQADFVN